MKNILYFSRTMDIGGAENVVIQLCETQKENFKKIIVCSSGGKRVDELINMGVIHYKIHDIDSKKPMYILSNFILLIYIIMHEKISIVHTHHRMAAFYIRILNFFFSFKHIYTAHNTFFDKKKLTHFSLKKSRIIAVGETVKKNLIDTFGIDNNDIVVIYNTQIKKEIEFTLIPEFNRIKEDNGIIITNVARLSKQKGLEYYISAAKYIVKKHKNIYFFIVGSGELKNQLKKQIEVQELQEYVFMLGYREDVQNIIKQSDLICLTSLWEGLPLVPIEAIALGKPVIATNVGGTKEVIIDNYNGYIVEKLKDSKEIAKAIDKALNESDNWAKLQNNAIKMFNDKFSSDKFILKHTKIYNE